MELNLFQVPQSACVSLHLYGYEYIISSEDVQERLK